MMMMMLMMMGGRPVTVKVNEATSQEEANLSVNTFKACSWLLLLLEKDEEEDEKRKKSK